MVKHIRSITHPQKAEAKRDDTAEQMFFQLFFTVISLMLSSAFSAKGR